MKMDKVDVASVVMTISRNPDSTHISVEFNYDLVTVYAEKHYFDFIEDDEYFMQLDLLTTMGFDEKQIEIIL